MPRNENGNTRIPVEPIREVILAQMHRRQMSFSEVARNCGWMCGTNKADSSRVKRRLGMTTNQACVRKGNYYEARLSTQITYANAVRLVRAVDLDPVDAGV